MKKISILAFISCQLISTFALAKEFRFVAHDFPPMSYDNKGIVEGGMVDIVKAACEQLKHTCKFEVQVLARAFKLAESGEIDGILNLYKVPEREKDYSDTSFLINSNFAYMALEKSKIQPVKSMDELKGYNVITVRGTQLSKYVKEHADKYKFTVQEDVSNPKIIERVIKKEYPKNSLIASTEDVLKVLGQRQGHKIETVYRVEDKGFLISFSKKKMSAEDAQAFIDVIEKMKKDGTTKKILSKYNLRAAE